MIAVPKNPPDNSFSEAAALFCFKSRVCMDCPTILTLSDGERLFCSRSPQINLYASHFWNENS